MGRITADPLRNYTWDLASRLTSYQGANGSATAGYDGLGMRISENLAGFGFTTVPSNFIWNYGTALPTVATVQTGSADQRYYVYTPSGTLLYAIDAASNARHFYHFDETGSTVMLTNDTGAVTDSYGITPYGETVTQSGTTPNPFTWLGQFGVMQEGSTGLYDMRTRWYDSATARFLSPDTVTSADPKEVDPYTYARANPIQFADATGAIAVDLTKYFPQDPTPAAAPRTGGALAIHEPQALPSILPSLGLPVLAEPAPAPAPSLRTAALKTFGALPQAPATAPK
jgi:RHS repeat-associated protein